MNIRSLCLAAASALAFALPGAAQTDLLPLQGERGRVVILDASRSMINLNFTQPTRERRDIATALVEEVFSRLDEMNDPTRTALVAFGADPARQWTSVRGNYASSSQYPSNGPLCSDSAVLLPFGPLGRQATNAAETGARIANGGDRAISSPGHRNSWGGMTLTHVAINQALAAFDPTIGGEIILISDMDTPNCLPPGARDTCGAIQPLLDRINSSGGQVTAKIFSVPDSSARQQLADCMEVINIPIPTNKPDLEKIVKEALETVLLTTRVIAGGPGNLDPDGVDLGAGTLVVRPAGRNIDLGNAPLGRMDLPRGRYDIELSLDGQTRTRLVNLTGPKEEVFELDGSRLTIDTTSTAGAPPQQLNLTIGRPGGGTIATIPYRVGETLRLGNGDYTLTGVDATGATDTTTVSLRLGALRNATLNFGGNGAASSDMRDVSINLSYAQPTLNTGSVFEPAVRLSGPGLPGSAVTTAGFSGGLQIGDYVLDIGTPRPHQLPFRVDAGPDRLSVDVVVTPGIFEARTSGASGAFELLDSTGTVLFTFTGTEVRHSIVDGTYEMRFRRDGTTTSQRFDVNAGERTTLRPF